jgi:hypothetical protein
MRVLTVKLCQRDKGVTPLDVVRKMPLFLKRIALLIAIRTRLVSLTGRAPPRFLSDRLSGVRRADLGGTS